MCLYDIYDGPVVLNAPFPFQFQFIWYDGPVVSRRVALLHSISSLALSCDRLSPAHRLARRSLGTSHACIVFLSSSHCLSGKSASCHATDWWHSWRSHRSRLACKLSYLHQLTMLCSSVTVWLTNWMTDWMNKVKAAQCQCVSVNHLICMPVPAYYSPCMHPGFLRANFKKPGYAIVGDWMCSCACASRRCSLQWNHRSDAATVVWLNLSWDVHF